MIIYIVSRIIRILQLEVDNTITVLELKKMIENLRQIPAENQVLTYQINVIDDNMSLMQYNIKHEDVIVLSTSRKQKISK